VFDGTWKEAFVALGDGGRFVEVLRTVDSIPEVLPKSAPLGSRAPIQTAATQWLHDVAQKVSKGRVLIFDYCSDSTSEIAISPWREWLRTYKNHARGEHYLLEPGAQDITAQVMIDQLLEGIPNLLVRKQSDWLQHWGMQDLVSEGAKYWEQHKSSPDVFAMKMRSRANEASLITDISGIGGYSVLELGS